MRAALAAGDVPGARAVVFGAVVVVLAGVVIGALWKGLAYAVGAGFEKVLLKVQGAQFASLESKIDHLHECFERRLGLIEARDTAANVVEMRRIADAMARMTSPARKDDPPGADHLGERALPPSAS